MLPLHRVASTFMSSPFEVIIAQGRQENVSAEHDVQDARRSEATYSVGSEARFTRIKTDLAIIKWMRGANLVAIAVLVIKVFTEGKL